VPAVLLGGVAVAFTLVELLPPDVLTPPNGNPAIAMLLALFLSALIGTAGLFRLPVSTTHIIPSSVAGTMAGSGAGVQRGVVWQIIIAWVVTPPATMVLSGRLFWLLSVE
jgi:PiT family inorganic phosphate transporter